MSSFVDRIAARATGREIAEQPRMHLRRRARFEPQWTAPQPIPAAKTHSPAPPDRRAAPMGREQAAPAAISGARPARAEAAPAVAAAPVEPDVPMPAPDPPLLASAPVPLPDPLVVVRERVVPVLVESGVLVTSDEVEVVDAATATPPDNEQRVQLRVAPAYPWRPSHVDLSDRQPTDHVVVPDIHVHIDRIDVIRPARQQPPEAPAPPPCLGAVDHGEYLARRRERR